MPKKKEGTKTIKLSIYFWTDIKDKEKYGGIELPKKHCWDTGFVSVVSNNLHGIRSGKFAHFNKFDELPNAVEDALARSGIEMIDSKKDKEYKEALQKLKDSKRPLKTLK